METVIQELKDFFQNRLFIKRDDLYPFCFGGNKARKAKLFFQQIDQGNFDHVVTYGSSSSNHCRVIANMCVARNLPCTIISPKEASEQTFNSILTDFFNAQRVVVPVNDVYNTIEEVIHNLKEKGKNPFFIPGGGHGNTGTQAYVNCYDEILAYQREKNLQFDYIFLASGTGTTQAGLISGKLLAKHSGTIIGISIARKNPRGRNVILDSVTQYLNNPDLNLQIENSTHFVDDFIGKGYATCTEQIHSTINQFMCKYGIPLDEVYTGKAVYGMQQYLIQKNIVDKNVLFLHTGGTPLFFNYLQQQT